MLFNFKNLVIASMLAVFAPSAMASDLKVDHVANAGVRISSGDKSVLVDALFGPHDFFNFLNEEDFNALIKEGADVAMSTHAHNDHFGTDRTAAFLNGNPQSLFLGTPRMLELLDGQVKPSQVATETFRKYGSKVFNHRGIKITVLDFPHMEPVSHPTKNYAYLIEMNGWTVLHVGDAGVHAEAIEGLKLADMNIDLAIIHDLFPVRNENYHELIKQMNIGKIAFMHMVDEKAEPTAKWITENLPGAGMLVTGYETIELTK